MIKKIFLILMVCFVSTAHADVFKTCLEKISSNDELWTQPLFNKSNGIFKSLKDGEELTDDIVQKQKAQIYVLLGKNILLNCRDDMAEISRQQRGQIPFKYNDEDYAFDFSVKTMFDYIDIRTGFVVINKRNLKPGDVIKLTDIPREQKFFPDECSDHVIWDNLDDDAAVNVAGQAVFNEFGGSKNEFFLDFADGDNRRAFPGLVLMDKTSSTAESIVTYRNIGTAFQKMQQFGERLKNSQCSNSGLALYTVALDVKQDTSKEKKGWAIAASVGGGAAVWIGASAAVTAAGVAGSGVIGTAVVGAMKATAATVGVAAGSVSWIPVAGWIAAGVLAVTATAIALYPSEIEDLKQVMVLDGPYLL